MSLITARELDLALNDLFSAASSASQKIYHSSKNENEYVFEIYAVGVLKEEAKIDIHDNKLTVIVEPKNKSYFTKPVNVFWDLPKDSDLESVDAKLENGVLTVRIARIKPAKRSVSVTVN